MSDRTPSQEEVLRWAVATFGDGALLTKERAMRFIEEALELAQACALKREEILPMIDRVWGNEPGNIHKECGQAYMTLMALAEARDVPLDDALKNEWSRVQDIPPDEWARRHNRKADLGLTDFRLGEDS